MTESLFITSEAPLEAGDAVAAIIVDADGRYVVQQRDEIPTIFFPGHWGCFGGAVEKGEPPVDALQRELREELALEVLPHEIKFFTRFDFDFSCLGGRRVYRLYYDVRITAAQGRSMRLQEGRAVQQVAGPELLLARRVTPYDAFAIWMHMRAVRACAS